MSDETVVVCEAIEVSREDAALLETDAFIYGHCFVEVFESGPGKRVDPARIVSGEIEVHELGLLRPEK